MNITALFIGIAAASSTALAGTMSVDGTADTNVYSDAIGLQNTSTSFGNNDMPDPVHANGSELDQLSAVVDQGILYIHLAGTLEPNWNKLELFLDFRDGGQNRILGINPDVDFEALQRLGDDGSGNGLTFDDGFTADYYITVGGGVVNDTTIEYHGSAAQLIADGSGTGSYLGYGSTTVDTDGNAVVTPIDVDSFQIAINNSFVGGVIGGSGLDCGEINSTVLTGVEIGIPLWVLDWDFEGIPFDDIRICAFVSSSDHGFASNQVLGGIGGGDNLGDPRNINLNDIAGNQFGTVGTVGDPCTPPMLGACCFANGECWENLHDADCFAARGLWMGDGTTCDDCDLGGGTDTCPTDTDDNGVIDVNDLLNVIATFNQVCP